MGSLLIGRAVAQYMCLYISHRVVWSGKEHAWPPLFIVDVLVGRDKGLWPPFYRLVEVLAVNLLWGPLNLRARVVLGFRIRVRFGLALLLRLDQKCRNVDHVNVDLPTHLTIRPSTCQQSAPCGR